jgi:hypothetical protein
MCRGNLSQKECKSNHSERLPPEKPRCTITVKPPTVAHPTDSDTSRRRLLTSSMLSGREETPSKTSRLAIRGSARLLPCPLRDQARHHPTGWSDGSLRDAVATKRFLQRQQRRILTIVIAWPFVKVGIGGAMPEPQRPRCVASSVAAEVITTCCKRAILASSTTPCLSLSTLTRVAANLIATCQTGRGRFIDNTFARKWGPPARPSIVCIFALDLFVHFRSGTLWFRAIDPSTATVPSVILTFATRISITGIGRELT